MEAYIDDSVTDGQVLVFGGLLASAERWKAFSNAWQQCLDDAPWDVFKMKKVTRRCTGRKREHAQQHYRTVVRHVQGGICFVVPIAPPEESVARYGLPRTLANPYSWAFKGIINGLAQNQRAWGLTEPVDFIFDERPESEKDTILDVWDLYLATVPDEVRSLTGRPPMFADDRTELPLQAADMWVWWCRKTWLENDGLIPADSYSMPWGKVGDIPQMILQLTAEDIDHKLSRISEALRANQR